MPNLDVKTAVRIAKGAAGEFYEEEDISDLLLEEVEFDEMQHQWLITLGFNTPNRNPMKGLAATLSPDRQFLRKYKVFNVDDDTATVKSMKIRDI